MGDIEIDDSQVVRLGLDLSRAPLRVQFGARKVTERGAEVIDRQMTLDAAGHIGNYFGIVGTEYVTPLPEHVSHEWVGDLEQEIGIESKGAGKLAHIIAYGSVNNAPAYDPMAGPLRKIPLILRNYAEMGEESVLGEGE